MQNQSHLVTMPNNNEMFYQKALRDNPEDPEIYYAYAIYEFDRNNLQHAYHLLTQSVKLNPNNGLYHRNLGEIARRLGNLDQAVLCGEAACKLLKKDADAFLNLGIAQSNRGNYNKAVTAYRSGLKINKNHDALWNNLGVALEELDKKIDALKSYDTATKVNPSNLEAHNNKGVMLCEMGELEKAKESFTSAIKIDPYFVDAHYNIASLKKFTPADEDIHFLEALYKQKDSLNIHSQVKCCFAYGKALEDIGKNDESFKAYNRGNQLESSLLNYDEIQQDKLVDDIIRIFSKEFLEKNRKEPSKNDKSRTPIFIIGVPRSGSSLLEQILDSHPSVFGAGEIDALGEAIKKVCKFKSDSQFPDHIEKVNSAEIQSIGKLFINSAWKDAPNSHFIVDKMLANFFYLGLIYIALPQAKIINTNRHPMDCGFSIFSRYFNSTMGFAYSQEKIGRYYRRYMRLMNHWREVLPQNYILNLQYENIVKNLNPEIQRVLDYLDLPWDDLCLGFYKNPRTVKTASIAQVRQPIYQNSIARWEKFAQHLKPLYEEVKDYCDPVDLSLFCNTQSDIDEPDIQELLNRVLALQAENEHERVGKILTPFLDEFGIRKETASLWHLGGISQYTLNNFTNACAYYEKAIELEPAFANAFNSLGFVLQDIGELAMAKNAFTRALEIAPEMAMARLNLGMLQLKMGDFAEGLENYESRWIGSAESIQGTFSRPPLPLQQWNGEKGTESSSLLVFAEQGFGDTFHYARYLLEAKQRFRKVGFVCSEPTARLLEWSMGNDVLILSFFPMDYAGWDWQCPLMSLPRAFKTRIDSIPAKVPYFKITQSAKSHWEERLEQEAPQRYKIGIAWAGRKTHKYDNRRSLSFDQLTPLFENKSVTWVSLQKWLPEETRPTIPQDIHWIDWTNELHDFADTGALIANLDLVISIDSSMIHLAGALNKPTWMLNRFDAEWRWLEFQARSPWYPNLQIFNQAKFGDWDSVINPVKEALKKLNIPFAPPPIGQKIKVTTTDETPQLMNASSIQPLSIGKEIDLANQLQSSGRLKEAKELLQNLLTLDPKNPHALHLLGIVNHQSSNQALAIELIEKAIDVDPNIALFHSNIMEMYRQQGDLEKAIEHGEIAVIKDPYMPIALSNLGVALFDAKLYERSAECHLKALSINPDLLQSLNNLGSIERAKENKVGAIQYYQRVLAIDPNYTESLINLGAVLVETERTNEAIPHLQKALKLNPESFTALCNLGLANLELGVFEFAENLLLASLKINPNYIESLIVLARLYHQTNKSSLALEALQKVISLDPNNIDALCQLGFINTEASQYEKAQNYYESALRIDSKNVEALTGLANLLLEDGQISASIEKLNFALTINPMHIGANFHLSQAQKVKDNSNVLRNLESLLLNVDSLPLEKQISLHYGLGKAYDDISKFDKAFHHFSLGAKMKRSTFQFDSEINTQRVSDLIRICTSDWFNQLQGTGNPSNKPIFILGMPRSGTTLTEQIIASHPQVFGAGELDLLLNILQSRNDTQAITFPMHLEAPSLKTLEDSGNQYIHALSQKSSLASRLTDKMPNNYMGLGLIPLILPNAKIIHVQRNPIDTCLSCFTRLFHSGQEETYDLVELGRHFNDYALLMEHWRKIMPANSFMEIEYESIVSDLDTQARKLIDWCDLEWDDACLDFYKHQRKIRTASAVQVREPIYQSSVARWKNYEPYLMPLINELRKGPLAHKL